MYSLCVIFILSFLSMCVIFFTNVLSLCYQCCLFVEKWLTSRFWQRLQNWKFSPSTLPAWLWVFTENQGNAAEGQKSPQFIPASADPAWLWDFPEKQVIKGTEPQSLRRRAVSASAPDPAFDPASVPVVILLNGAEPTVPPVALIRCTIDCWRGIKLLGVQMTNSATKGSLLKKLQSSLYVFFDWNRCHSTKSLDVRENSVNLHWFDFSQLCVFSNIFLNGSKVGKLGEDWEWKQPPPLLDISVHGSSSTCSQLRKGYEKICT